MKVYLHEIKEDQEYMLQFNEDAAWVSEIVTSLDEKMHAVARPPGWKPKRRGIITEFRMRKIDDLYHVEGRVRTQVNLLCSLCADGFPFPIDSQFHVLYTKNPAYLGAVDANASGDLEIQRVFGKQSQSDQADEGAGDYEVNVLEGNTIDLGELLHEQMLLLIPMQPKPDVDEHERCVKCGIDRRTRFGRSDDEDEKTNPFSVLKDLFPKK